MREKRTQESSTDDQIHAPESLAASDVVLAEEVCRLRYRSLVMGNEPFSRVVFVCAETGMGKTWLSQNLLLELSRSGFFTSYVSLQALESRQATSRLARVARSLRRATPDARDQKVVVIDDVPPFEECDLVRAKNSLTRMVSSSALVIVNLLPEAEVLVEELPECSCVRSADLAYVYQQEAQFVLDAQKGATGGIASLIFGLASSGISGEDMPFEMRLSTYARSLAALGQGHIRKTLTLEEQRLRLLMLLLGHGSFEELSFLVEKNDEEFMDLLQRDAPLFGVDTIQGSFSCVGFDEPDVFAACIDQLRDLCSELPETTVLAVRALASREEYLRAAQVLELCDRHHLVEFAVTWGVELVCAGKASLVRRALELCEEEDSLLGEERLLSERALALMDLPCSKFDERPLPEAHLAETRAVRRRRKLLELLHATRDLDRGVVLTRMPTVDDEEQLATTLFEHVKARSLLLSGRASEVYTMLVNNPARLNPDTLCSALLCDDFEMAQMLTGEAPHVNEQVAYMQARQTIENAGIKRLACYRSVLEPMMVVLAGREESFDGVEEVMARAARMGDSAVHAVLLLTSAVLDNRNGAYPRAHVRALQAAECLGGHGNRYLSLVSRFVDALAASGLGDDDPLVALSLSGSGSMVRDLAAFAVCAGNGEEMQIELTTLDRSSCSRDAAWMLNVMCNDFGERSHLFRQRVPSSWSALSRRSVRKMQGMSRLMERGTLVPASARESRAKEASGQSQQVEKEERSRRIHIQLLGEFAVFVDGKQVSSAGFGRRRARAFLTLVASSRMHSISRHTIIESIWPQVDYGTGKQKIYEVTSTIRHCLRTSENKLDPFVRSRDSAMVTIDTSVVSCDVEQFERSAHLALSEEDDARVVELACKAVSYYRGDLCDNPYDAQGEIAARRIELKTLFVDVSIAGARAAMHQDMLQLSVRMAWAAHEASGMREDVVLVLLEALKASGRAMDAREVYRDYARNLLEASGMPPSATMRAAVSGLFPEGRKRAPGRSGKRREDHTLSC